jgi:hypothetical protein
MLTSLNILQSVKAFHVLKLIKKNFSTFIAFFILYFLLPEIDIKCAVGIKDSINIVNM